jgi:hypothetical protein
MSGNRRSPRFPIRGRGGGPIALGLPPDDDDPGAQPLPTDDGTPPGLVTPAGVGTPTGTNTPPAAGDQTTPVAGSSATPLDTGNNNFYSTTGSTGDYTDNDITGFDPATATPEQMADMLNHLRSNYLHSQERESARREQTRLSKQREVTPSLHTPSSPSSPRSSVPTASASAPRLGDGAIPAAVPAANLFSALTPELFNTIRDFTLSTAAMAAGFPFQYPHSPPDSQVRQVRFADTRLPEVEINTPDGPRTAFDMTASRDPTPQPDPTPYGAPLSADPPVPEDSQLTPQERRFIREMRKSSRITDASSSHEWDNEALRVCYHLREAHQQNLIDEYERSLAQALQDGDQDVVTHFRELLSRLRVVRRTEASSERAGYGVGGRSNPRFQGEEPSASQLPSQQPVQHTLDPPHTINPPALTIIPSTPQQPSGNSNSMRRPPTPAPVVTPGTAGAPRYIDKFGGSLPVNYHPRYPGMTFVNPGVPHSSVTAPVVHNINTLPEIPEYRTLPTVEVNDPYGRLLNPFMREEGVELSGLSSLQMSKYRRIPDGGSTIGNSRGGASVTVLQLREFKAAHSNDDPEVVFERLKATKFRKVVPPKPWLGDSNFPKYEAWVFDALEYIESIGQFTPGYESEAVQTIGTLLDGDAKEWFRDNVRRFDRSISQWDLELVLRGLESRYHNDSVGVRADRALENLKQGSKSIQQYITETLRYNKLRPVPTDDLTLAKLWYDGLKPAIQEGLKHYRLSPSDFSLEGLVLAAQSQEDYLAKDRVRDHSTTSTSNTTTSSNNNSNSNRSHSNPNSNSSSNNNRNNNAQRENRPNFNRSQPRQHNSNATNVNQPRVNSQPQGQVSYRPPIRDPASRPFQSNIPPRPPPKDIPRTSAASPTDKCHICGKFGHWARDHKLAQSIRVAAALLAGSSDMLGGVDEGTTLPDNGEDNQEETEFDSDPVDSALEESRLEVLEDEDQLQIGPEPDDELGYDEPEYSDDEPTVGFRMLRIVQDSNLPSAASVRFAKAAPSTGQIRDHGIRYKLGRRPERPLNSTKCLTAYIMINGYCAKVLWDSACEGIMASPSFAKVAKFEIFQLVNPVKLQLAVTGSRSSVNYGANAAIQIGSNTLNSYIDIASVDDFDVILGTPVLWALGICLDFRGDGGIWIGEEYLPNGYRPPNWEKHLPNLPFKPNHPRVSEGGRDAPQNPQPPSKPPTNSRAIKRTQQISDSKVALEKSIDNILRQGSSTGATAGSKTTLS